jgi:hypothetical protein
LLNKKVRSKCDQIRNNDSHEFGHLSFRSNHWPKALTQVGHLLSVSSSLRLKHENRLKMLVRYNHLGAVTLSIMTLSITTFSIMGINDLRHKTLSMSI